MFKSFWGRSQEAQQISAQSPLAGQQRASDPPPSPSHSRIPPTETAGVIDLLKNKDVDELQKLLTDKGAYKKFLYSLDEVKDQNSLQEELCKEAAQLARRNLEKEPQILELRNQCRIIQTTELLAAREKLEKLEKEKDQILNSFTPSMLQQRMQDAMEKIEEESQMLDRQLLDKEIDLAVFVQRYMRLRTTYHRQALLQLAAQKLCN
ncbi:hypothetical protein MRB53_004683 [Persea americana]|uniref:Uncharacterized protein n=1 Tax=Persea americana TaxID=3435 RepID=A0ACC2MBV6_PERAE|nr:hypothetical protein MRB53_004683 [Persea americana]